MAPKQKLGFFYWILGKNYEFIFRAPDFFSLERLFVVVTLTYLLNLHNPSNLFTQVLADRLSVYDLIWGLPPPPRAPPYFVRVSQQQNFLRDEESMKLRWIRNIVRERESEIRE